MISYKEFKSMQNFADLVVAYDLDLDFLRETIYQNPHLELTEEILNELVGNLARAAGNVYNAAVGFSQGGFKGAKDRINFKNSDKARQNAMEKIKGLFTDLTSMGVPQDRATGFINSITKQVQNSFDSMMKSNMYSTNNQQAQTQTQQTQQPQTPQTQQQQQARTPRVNPKIQPDQSGAPAMGGAVGSPVIPSAAMNQGNITVPAR